MHVRLQPARIIQCARFHRHRTAAPLGFVVYPGAASRAEDAELGSTRLGFRREAFWFASGEAKVGFADDQSHAKGAAGLALTVGAMANHELAWFGRHFIANVAALTASRVFSSHNFNPPGCK